MSDNGGVTIEAAEYGRKLCSAVQAHRCLYDRRVKVNVSITKAAWEAVAKRLNDNASNCRKRWASYRKYFCRSYKKYGPKLNYYLHPYMTFLIPHLRVTSNEAGPSNRHTTNCTNKSQNTLGPTVPQNITNETIPDELLQPINEIQPNGLNEKTSDINTSEISGRCLRIRNKPKRFVDMDFSSDKFHENRLRCVMQRRKSVGGLVMRDYGLNKTPTEIWHASENRIAVRPECNSIPTCPDILTPAPPSQDSFTNTGTSGKLVSVGTQCQPVPRVPHDEFLKCLKSSMETMNHRQKVNFKERVYQALMDVLDDCSNFPKQNEIVKPTSAVAEDFQTAPSSEMQLIRELVSPVKAAKTNPEFGETDRNKQLESPIELPTTSSAAAATLLTTSPIQAIQNVENQTTPSGFPSNVLPISAPNLAQHKDNGTAVKPATIASMNPLIMKRIVRPKSIEIASSNGSTIWTQGSDKRLVFRIYPRNASNRSLPAISNSGAQLSTNNVTSPSTPQQRAEPSTPNSTLPSTPQQGKPSKYIMKTGETISPNQASAVTNAPNRANTITPAHGNGVNEPDTVTTFSEPAPPKNRPIGAQHRMSKPYKITVGTPPSLQKISFAPKLDFKLPPRIISQRVTASSSSVTNFNQSNRSRLQLPNVVSFNTATNLLNQNETTKFVPAINYNNRPRIPPPLPDLTTVKAEPKYERKRSISSLTPSEVSPMETAGTIATDNFSWFFDDKPIKDEPEPEP